MELHIKDRIYIPQLLPAQNSFMEYNLKREIIKKVALTETDKEEYAIVEDAQAGKVTWDSKKDMEQPLVVDFSKQEIDYLKKSCEALAEAAHPDDLWATVRRSTTLQMLNILLRKLYTEDAPYNGASFSFNQCHTAY